MEAKDLIVGMVFVQFIALCAMVVVGIYYLTNTEGLRIALVITIGFIIMTVGALLSPKTGGL